MKKISEDQVLKNIEIVKRLVKKFPEERKVAVEKMLDGEIGQVYFTAPASSRESFHSAYPGGLVQHSLNVVLTLNKLVETLCPGKYEKHQLAFVGLFHDLGKVGDGSNERYLPNDNNYQKVNYGKLYNINQEMNFLTTAEGSLFLLQQNDIKITHDEYLAIKLNDGQYDPANADYKMKETDLSLLLHWADLWSTRREKD